MKKNRFSIVNSYKKEQSIELLGKLTVEQLLTIINFNNKDILLVYDDNLAFTDLPIVDLKRRPSHGFKIIECMLVKFSKVE